MAKIICDYCEFGNKDKLCYKGGMDKCQGELFMCRQKADTGDRRLTIPDLTQECFRVGYEQGYKDCEQMDNREQEGYEEWKRKHFA